MFLDVHFSWKTILGWSVAVSYRPSKGQTNLAVRQSTLVKEGFCAFASKECFRKTRHYSAAITKWYWYCEFSLPLFLLNKMAKKGEAPPQFLHLCAAMFIIRQPWWRSFWFASSSPSKARGDACRLQTHIRTLKSENNVKSCKIQNLETVFYTYWILLVSQLILVFNLRSTSIISIPSSITSHLDQLCRFNGPESRQVEPRAELQQTMKPAELQSDARGRPPLAVQRPVMPPTSPQGPSSPSGIDNLGQQDADRRRPLWDPWDEVWSWKFGSFKIETQCKW